MLKSDLRLQYISLRNDLSPEQISHYSLTLANKMLNIPIWDADNYHLFLPIIKKKEVDTAFILSILQGKDKNVILPKMTGTKLEHYLLTDRTVLKMNKWNVPEPVDGIAIEPDQIDVVFIPLLAFDLKGNRVGYGKGYYDGFLKECKADVLKVGLSFFKAEEIIEDISEDDIPLDYCITPAKIYAFSSST